MASAQKAVLVTIEGAPELKARLEQAGRDAPLAMTRALNRVMTQVRTSVIRELADETDLANKDIRPGTTLLRAKQSDPTAVVRITGRRIPLLAFKARQTRKGVSYKLRHGRGFAPTAFFATMASGHRGVFKRTGKFGRRGKKYLERIGELFGPSLPKVVIEQKIDEKQKQLIGDLLPDRLSHELDFLLQGKPVGTEAVDAS